MLYIAVTPTADLAADASRRETIARFFAAIRAGDYPALQEVLTPDAVTSWPQSGEQVTGALGCVRAYQNYPGGAPIARVDRISGGGDAWVAELVADYGDQRWHLVSVIEFEGPKISRMTDYFGASFPAPEWRQEWLDREDAMN
jgi:hypothetical protein